MARRREGATKAVARCRSVRALRDDGRLLARAWAGGQVSLKEAGMWGGKGLFLRFRLVVLFDSVWFEGDGDELVTVE